jgi:hypothetical protein
MNSDLLDRIESVWSAARDRYRDAMIEVGGLIQELILERAAAAGGLEQSVRLARGLSRESAVADVCRRLAVRRPKVYRLLKVTMAVRLLAGGGGAGDLSYAALLEFGLLVERTPGVLGRTKASKVGELSPAERETYRVRLGLEEKAPALFRSAVSERWTCDEVRSAVAGLVYRRAAKAGERPRSSQETNKAAAADPLRMARAALPKDLAEVILGMIGASPEPECVAELVRRGLGDGIAEYRSSPSRRG